jgi:hypothetical protein
MRPKAKRDHIWIITGFASVCDGWVESAAGARRIYGA